MEILFYSQLNTSGREPTTSDIPVSHSIDIPTEVYIESSGWLNLSFALNHICKNPNAPVTKELHYIS